MNERIKQLKAQARDFYLAQEDLDCSITELHEIVDAKFAELIVRECVIRAEREWIRNGLHTEHNQAVSKVIESIKQHFGVEE